MQKVNMAVGQNLDPEFLPVHLVMAPDSCTSGQPGFPGFDPQPYGMRSAENEEVRGTIQ